MIDFAALPPEINSGRMYSGPGSASLRQAGVSWSRIAAEMRSATVAYRSVISALVNGKWLGPSSESMTAAAAAFASWMNTTAAQAEQTAVAAQSATQAYESAYALTVPPAAIVANRARLKALVANNVLGHHTAAIAATEAQYGQMWAQDAEVMYGYAASSAAASQLPTLISAPTTTKVSAQTATKGSGQIAAQGACTAAAASSSATASTTASSSDSGPLGWLEQITAPGSNTATTGLAGLLNDLSGSNGGLLGSFLNDNSISGFSNAITTNGVLNPTAMLDSVTCFSYLFPTLAQTGVESNVAGLAAGLSSATSSVGAAAFSPMGLSGLGAAVSAGLGTANPLGALSVPTAWTVSAPSFATAAATLPGTMALTPPLGGTPMVAPLAPALAGAPMGALAGMQSHDLDDPMYGFRPMVMARPPAAG